MFFQPKFFYDDNATEGTGGNAEGGTTNTENNSGKPINTTVDVLKPLFSEEEIKGLGFDSIDQMKQHLKETKETRVPEDVKKRNAEVEKADFLKVSTEEGLMNVDEYSAYESVKNKSDRDLVYEKYAADFKEDNPDATDELIKNEFESDYKLGDKNEKLKNRGESRLKKEAEGIRSPLSSKFTAAKNFVDNYRLTTKEEPAFRKFVDDLVLELTPDTMTIAKAKDDEDELDIPVKFTKEQRDEIAKMFKNPKTFAAYIENKDKLKETLSPSLTKKINSIIKVNNFDSAVSFAFENAKKIGIKKGSSVGAEQPFGLVKNIQRANVTPTALQEVEDSEKKLRQKYAR